jgi:hypothetical protein
MNGLCVHHVDNRHLPRLRYQRFHRPRKQSGQIFHFSKSGTTTSILPTYAFSIFPSTESNRLHAASNHRKSKLFYPNRFL